MISTKKCLICNKGKKNDVLMWHTDPETGDIWCWCCKCDRGYSIYQYVSLAGLKLNEFLKGTFDFKEATPNEVNKIAWPSNFLALSDPRSEKGVEYVKSRGIAPGDSMFYDAGRKGIVFPYYFGNTFCGAQIRLIEPWIDEDGEVRKIDTIPGTRLGLLFYGWNQEKFMTNIKGVIIAEGAFNSLAIQQSLDEVYGGYLNNPWKAIASSGTGLTEHKLETMRDLKKEGIKVVLAPDPDKAGMKMLRKAIEADAITHYNLAEGKDCDWNDIAQQMDKRHFAQWFLKGMKSVKK